MGIVPIVNLIYAVDNDNCVVTFSCGRVGATAKNFLKPGAAIVDWQRTEHVYIFNPNAVDIEFSSNGCPKTVKYHL